MERNLFGHRLKKKQSIGMVPGRPFGERFDDQGGMSKGGGEGKSKDGPPGYEGKEHVKYKNPGFTRHRTSEPGDEPKMKSHASREEMHEMEDNYHMDVPDQTEDTLASKIKRARMKMDAPDQEEPDRLRGNMVEKVGQDGVEDTSGEEEMGSNDMQSDSKERRKKMIVAVTKRKMNKKKNAMTR